MGRAEARLARLGAGRPGAEPHHVVTANPSAGRSVSSDAGTLASALVLRPSAAVDRLPPIKGEPSPIADRAREQHAVFVRTLRDRGVIVHEMEPSTESPTESLVADCAIMLREGAIIARPSQLERRADVGAVERRLTELGVRIAGRIEAPGLLDATDVAVGTDTLYVGVPRYPADLRRCSNELGRKQLELFASQSGYRIVELPISTEVQRLRDAFSLVGTDSAIAAPDHVDLSAITGLRIVAIPRGEDLAAGVLALGERRVIANLRFRESVALMRKAKIAVEAIDLWEFGKAGFGPFSLALAVKRG